MPCIQSGRLPTEEVIEMSHRQLPFVPTPQFIHHVQEDHRIHPPGNREQSSLALPEQVVLGNVLFHSLSQFGHVAMLGLTALWREFDSRAGVIGDWRSPFAAIPACYPRAMDLERDGNLIEAGLWFFLALVLLVYALRQNRRIRATLVFLSLTLAVFGGSDLVEAQTGAWWKPWWLFVWKAVCVLLLFVGFTRYYRIKRTVSVSLQPPARETTLKQ